MEVKSSDVYGRIEEYTILVLLFIRRILSSADIIGKTTDLHCKIEKYKYKWIHEFDITMYNTVD